MAKHSNYYSNKYQCKHAILLSLFAIFATQLLNMPSAAHQTRMLCQQCSIHDYSPENTLADISYIVKQIEDSSANKEQSLTPFTKIEQYIVKNSYKCSINNRIVSSYVIEGAFPKLFEVELDSTPDSISIWTGRIAGSMLAEQMQIYSHNIQLNCSKAVWRIESGQVAIKIVFFKDNCKLESHTVLTARITGKACIKSISIY